MKKYRPKGLLDIAIKATQDSLNIKWATKNKTYEEIEAHECSLCKASIHNTKYDFNKMLEKKIESLLPNSCKRCPLAQYSFMTYGRLDCGDAYMEWDENHTQKNRLAVKRDLRNTLKWLKEQK